MKKIDKLFTTEQAAKQLHISPRTLNNDRNTGTGIVIAHTGEVRGLLDIVVSTEKNRFTHTGEVRGLLDTASSKENNTLTHTGKVKGLLAK
jgi:hypothetical protein